MSVKKLNICPRDGIPCVFALPHGDKKVLSPWRTRACLVAAKMFEASNHAKCGLCGDIIVSRSVHDFQTCKCGNISVDGGNDYSHASAKEPKHFLRYVKGKWTCGLKTKKGDGKMPKPAKCLEIVEQYTGNFQQITESKHGDAQHVRLILRGADGSERVLYRGSKFSDEAFKERTKARK